MLKSLIAIGLLQLLSMLFLLVRTKGLALMLGPELVGIMGVIDRLLAVVAQTAALSLPFAALRFLPTAWSTDRAEYRVLLNGMRNVSLVAAGIATLGCVLVTLIWPEILGDELTSHGLIVRVGFLTVPILVLVPFLQHVAAGRLEHNRAMVLGLGNAFVLMATGLLGVWWGGLTGLYLAYAVVGVLLVWPVLRAFGDRTPVEPQPQRTPERLIAWLPTKVWRFSLSLFGLSFLAPYAALFVAYQVLVHHGEVVAGWMLAAVGISIAVRSVIGMGHRVMLAPNISKDATPPQRMYWANEFQKTHVLLALFVVPPVLLWPRFVIQLLYSGEFLPGAEFVTLFVVLEIILLVSSTYQTLVWALGHIGLHVLHNVIAQGLMIGVAALTIKEWGVTGAAAAGLIAPIFMFAASMVFLRRRYSLRVPLRNATLYCYVLAGLATTGFLGLQYPGFALQHVALKCGVYVALLAVAWLFLAQADRQRLQDMLRKLPSQFRRG
ncbi:MAG: MATE family efflux transporter [Planctomycetota bacterium]|jgi:PST family polysaccharide transporter